MTDNTDFDWSQLIDSNARIYTSFGFALGILSTYIFTLIKFIFYDYLEWQYSVVLISMIALSMSSRIYHSKKQLDTLVDFIKVMGPPIKNKDLPGIINGASQIITGNSNGVNNGNRDPGEPSLVNFIKYVVTQPPASASSESSTSSSSPDTPLISGMEPSSKTSLESSNSDFKPRTTGSADIAYLRDGEKKHLNIPYHTNLRRVGNRFRFHLMINDKETVDVTHQAGIPYFCTAKELGGIGYKIIDKSDDLVVHEYEEHEVPSLDFLKKYL